MHEKKEKKPVFGVRDQVWLKLACSATETRIYIGLDATKPVSVVSDKVRLKPACSNTETSLKIEISLVVVKSSYGTFQYTTNNGAVRAARGPRLRLCGSQNPRTCFLATRPIYIF